MMALAQQGAMPVIGFLVNGVRDAPTALATYRKGLNETGFVEGRNVTIELFANNVNDRRRELLSAPDGHAATDFDGMITRAKQAIEVTEGELQVAKARAYDPAVLDPSASGRAYEAEYRLARLRNARGAGGKAARGAAPGAGRFAPPAPASEPMVIRTGLPLRGPGSLRSEFFADGSRKDEFEPEFEEMDDARRRRRRTVARDPMGREAGEYTEEDRAAFQDHRPGFRYSVTAADRARVDEAYRQMCHDLITAWMTDEQRAQHDARLTTDACPDGVDPRDWAYSEMVRDLTDAWKPKDGAADARPTEYQSAKEGAQTPKGIWPLGAIPKHINTNVKAGDPCFQDGASGVYVDGGGGFLYCKVQPMPTTRADAVPPRFISVEDAQVIRDRAYQTVFPMPGNSREPG
jgi:hypothetical protein